MPGMWRELDALFKSTGVDIGICLAHANLILYLTSFEKI